MLSIRMPLVESASNLRSIIILSMSVAVELVILVGLVITGNRPQS